MMIKKVFFSGSHYCCHYLFLILVPSHPPFPCLLRLIFLFLISLFADLLLMRCPPWVRAFYFHLFPVLHSFLPLLIHVTHWHALCQIWELQECHDNTGQCSSRALFFLRDDVCSRTITDCFITFWPLSSCPLLCHVVVNWSAFGQHQGNSSH